MMLDGILAKDSIPSEQTAATEASETIDRAIQQVRSISHLLHPPLLDEVGLLSALRWYLDGLSKRSGIETSSRCPAAQFPGRLKSELETAIFRIIQEALTNVFRHSGARNGTVSVAEGDGNIRSYCARRRERRGTGSDAVAPGKRRGRHWRNEAARDGARRHLAPFERQSRYDRRSCYSSAKGGASKSTGKRLISALGGFNPILALTPVHFLRRSPRPVGEISAISSLHDSASTLVIERRFPWQSA